MNHLLLSLLLAALPLAAFDSETDWTSAQARSQSQHRPMLLFFTGSDWCGWCQRMQKEILDKKDFVSYLRRYYVPLLVDVPRGADVLPPEKLAENQELVARYRVEMFPTLLVLSPEGKVLGEIRGGRDDSERVKEELEKARKAGSRTSRPQ